MACSRHSDNGECRKKLSGGEKGKPPRCFFPLTFLCTAPANYLNDWNRLRSNLHFNLSSEIPKQSPLLKDDKCTLSSSVHPSTLLPWPAVIEKKTHTQRHLNNTLRGCVTAVQLILFNFANYSPSIATELKVSKEITWK